MKVVLGPRASGKTTEAIKLANEEDAYLAVRTRDRASQVYHDDGYPDLDRFPISYDELDNFTGKQRPRRVVIDNVGAFLRFITKVEISGISVGSEDVTRLDADRTLDREELYPIRHMEMKPNKQVIAENQDGELIELGPEPWIFSGHLEDDPRYED